MIYWSIFDNLGTVPTNHTCISWFEMHVSTHSPHYSPRIFKHPSSLTCVSVDQHSVVNYIASTASIESSWFVVLEIAVDAKNNRSRATLYFIDHSGATFYNTSWITLNSKPESPSVIFTRSWKFWISGSIRIKKFHMHSPWTKYIFVSMMHPTSNTTVVTWWICTVN